MDKISVIISCYNTSAYVERCIDSILNQSYQNMEIVIVEDKSTDDTKDKLKKYENHEKIKILFNEKNSGLSYSRNRGLQESTGDYIGYIDSDDYIEEDYYSNLMAAIQKENAEIAVCGIKVVNEQGDLENANPCHSSDLGKLAFVNNGLAASACNKLFKREIISKNPFSVGKVNEDIAVVIPALVTAKKVAYAENTYYYYVQRENSIQNSSFSDKRFDIFYGVDLTLERIQNHAEYESIKDALVFHQLIVLLLYVIPKEPNPIKRYKILKKYNRLIRKYQIRNNIYLKEFLDGQQGKHKIYCNLLVKYNTRGWYLCSDALIEMYRTLKKCRPPVIKKNITMSDLVTVAKKQKKRKEIVTISVVVPNYNYEKFLYQRLYSILSQTVKIKEIIILDDCSTDNSHKVIDDIVEKLSPYIAIKKIYNEKNSGSAFRQWQKGLKEASGDYVWIAEADDYCDSNMLAHLVNPLTKHDNIMISYCDTAMIDIVGNKIYRSVVPEIDIMKTNHWNRNYVMDGNQEYQNYSFLNCTIANVSSCIIKKGNYDDILQMSGEYKQAGDWFFYVCLMHKGKIAYCKKTMNYYRVHGSNVSSVTKKEAHMKEIKKIHSYFESNYGLNEHQKEQIQKRYEFLQKVWGLKKEI